MSDIVYLDVCRFKRPFDDQRQARIQLETTAVAALIELAERGDVRLVRSPAHGLENERNPREDRRLAASVWLGAAREEVHYVDGVGVRAAEIERLGFAPLDALHLAFAEKANARCLVTTDDRLMALGARHRQSLRVEVVGPIRALEGLKEGEA